MTYPVTPRVVDEGLARILGVRQLAAGSINATVGAGIFLVPALAAAQLGPAAPLAFLACGAAMGLVATVLAIAGSRVSITGGIYAYVEAAFGPAIGFVAGALQWLSFVLAAASVASALLAQVAAFVPVLGGPIGRLVSLAAVLTVLAAINARGARAGARTIELLTVAKLLPLLIFLVIGAAWFDPGAMAWTGTPEPAAVSRAALIIVFAFLGMEVAIAPGGEMRDPARTVPRALLLALVLTTALYMAIQTVAQGVLGAALANSTAAPLADAAAVFLGPTGRTLMLLGAMCSMFGYLSGDMLSTPRTLYAFARDGVLPRAVARIHPARRTPQVAIWIHAAVVFGLASTNTFEYLAVVTNVATLTLYLLACAAAVALQRRDVRDRGEPFVFPGSRFVPFAAIGVTLWILSSAAWQEVAATALMLALAAVFRGWRAWRAWGAAARRPAAT